jgi:hypothetical protein
MANSKTLVEIVENSYCTAFSDILWDKKHGSREQVTESVFVCNPHLQEPREAVTAAESKRERSANLLCVQVHKELLLLLQTIERARVQRSVLKGTVFPLIFFAIRVPNEIPHRDPQSQSGSRFALYWGSLK